MRRSLLIALFAFMAVALAAGAVLWSQMRGGAGKAKQFEVRGIVRGVDTNDGTLLVEHEQIPDYMPAMTMSLPVKNRAILSGVKIDDAIEFTLSVSEDDSWISHLEKRSAGAINRPATNATDASAQNETGKIRVQAGERVPDFTVVDQRGRARSLSDFRGQVVLINFIYVRCPLPNFCPLLSKKFADLQQSLSTNAGKRFHLISVTIDPEHDTSDVLKRYAKTWTKDESTWTFGLAGPAELRRIADSFGLIYERSAAGQIDHDLRTVLIDPQGRLVHIWKSNFWKREEVMQRVNEL